MVRILEKERDLFRSREKAGSSLAEVEDEELKGPLKMQNVVGNFSRTPGKIKHAGPKLGEHNKEILVDMLGFDQEQLIKAGYSLSSPELEENHD